MTALALALGGCATSSQSPSATVDAPSAGFTYVDIELASEAGRSIPVRVFRPLTDCSPCGLIIFSHGAFATYDRYDVLLTAWAEAGYVVAAPQHVDSEKHPARETYLETDPQPYRLEDYFAVSSLFASADYSLDGLTFSGTQFAAGHSFGGLIALLVGGAELTSGPIEHPDDAPEPEAIVAISPPGEIPDRILAEGYAEIETPLLVVTGTTDILPGFIDEWELHLISYDANRDDVGHALIFDGMNHYFNGAFGRIKPEGASAKTAIDTLNTQITAFLKAASDDVAPSGPDWEQSTNPIVRTLGQ